MRLQPRQALSLSDSEWATGESPVLAEIGADLMQSHICVPSTVNYANYLNNSRVALTYSAGVIFSQQHHYMYKCHQYSGRQGQHGMIFFLNLGKWWHGSWTRDWSSAVVSFYSFVSVKKDVVGASEVARTERLLRIRRWNLPGPAGKLTRTPCTGMMQCCHGDRSQDFHYRSL